MPLEGSENAWKVTNLASVHSVKQQLYATGLATVEPQNQAYMGREVIQAHDTAP